LHVAIFIKGLKNAPQLKQRFKKIGSSLASIKITDTDKSGIVQWIRIVDSNKRTFKLSGVELRSTFINRVKSLSFSLKLVRDRIVIHGHGHGHQQGMCQWGAKELIDRGWSVKSILAYYYPGTRLSRLL
jgi:stage II sporulation protein D